MSEYRGDASGAKSQDYTTDQQFQLQMQLLGELRKKKISIKLLFDQAKAGNSDAKTALDKLRGILGDEILEKLKDVK